MGVTYKKRFGFLAVEHGFITIDQLIEGMTIQVREDTGDKRGRRIGEILRSLGYMTDARVEEVLRLQDAGSIELPEEKIPTGGRLESGGR